MDPAEAVAISKPEAETTAVHAFEAVFEHGPKIELDHHLVYHARECLLIGYSRACTDGLMCDGIADYELGRLLACQGKEELAREQFELVLSGMSSFSMLLAVHGLGLM